MKGYRCLNWCNDVVDFENADEYGEAILWSDTANWADETLPAEGAEVHIEPGVNMIYDIEGDSPVFDYVRVNGRLSFATDIDINFQAKRIFVRGGEMILGTPEEPLLNNVNITLVGD
jgi:hypothetical protein